MEFAVRLGLKYARGLREQEGQALVREHTLAPFVSIHDLARRVPELRKDELTTLAEIGALNTIHSPQSHPSTALRAGSVTEKNNSSLCHPERSRAKSEANRPAESKDPYSSQKVGEQFHRRDALWQVERAVRCSGPLLEELPEPDTKSPLKSLTQEERLVADFRGTGLTVGPHPMQYRRAEVQEMGIYRASDLPRVPNGRRVRIGGCVIARQRPGTAKGMMFMSLEDETGIANAIVAPDLLQKNRVLLNSEQFLMIEGILQNQDNVIHVRAEKVLPLRITRAETVSHDFH